MEFGDLTVEQYQECDKIINRTKEDEFLGDLTVPVRIISYLHGIKEDDVLSMPRSEIVRLYSELSFLHQSEQLDTLKAKEIIVTNRTIYRADMDTPEMKAGALLGLKYFESQPNPIEYLHDQLATIYMPVNLLGRRKKYQAERHKKIAEDMRHAKLKDVYGLLVFKKKVFEKLSPVMEISLRNATATIQEILPEVMAWAKQQGLKVS